MCILFSRFDENTHTFLSTHISRPDGSHETEIDMPGSEGGGRWFRSGDHIAVTAVLADSRIETAIITPDGTVARVLDIPDDSLNLACTVWSPDDKRLALRGVGRQKRVAERPLPGPLVRWRRAAAFDQHSS